MDFLIILFAVWWLGAFVTYIVLFKRFMVRKDIRRPRDLDGFDIFGPVVGILLIVCALVLLNPVRYAQVVAKALGWPATLYLTVAGRRAGPASAPAGDGAAPQTVAGSSAGDLRPPDPDQTDPPTTPLAVADIALPTQSGGPPPGIGARKPMSSAGSALSALPHSHIPTWRRP